MARRHLESPPRHRARKRAQADSIRHEITNPRPGEHTLQHHSEDGARTTDGAQQHGHRATSIDRTPTQVNDCGLSRTSAIYTPDRASTPRPHLHTSL
ncbi:unnamed protein product [Dicrocoelium dendriticum]|nr:unnamed protein product [Dicrocoelium dendriticum]